MAVIFSGSKSKGILFLWGMMHVMPGFCGSFFDIDASNPGSSARRQTYSCHSKK